MLKKGPTSAMIVIKGEMVHLLRVYIFIVFQYANSMNMVAFPTHAILIWKCAKWNTFLNKSIGSQILKRPQYPYISVCVKEKNNVFKTHIYNSVFLSSSRNG